jgi:outer membrane biosynthesis protein TonB
LFSVSREPQFIVASYRAGVSDQFNSYAVSNFPSEAQGRYGTGLALSTIASNGQVLEMNLLRSSGDPILDGAFLKTFCGPGGYGEFSELLRKKTSVLHITLPFTFTNDTLRESNP